MGMARCRTDRVAATTIARTLVVLAIGLHPAAAVAATNPALPRLGDVRAPAALAGHTATDRPARRISWPAGR